jgi:hypothetical protein
MLQHLLLNPNKNTILPPEYNANNSYDISRNSIEQLIKDGFSNLFTTKNVNNSSNILDINNIENQIYNINNEVLIDSNTQIIEIPRIEITSIEDNLSSNNLINNLFENNEENLLTQSQENITKIGLKDQLNQIFKGLRKIKS